MRQKFKSEAETFSTYTADGKQRYQIITKKKMDGLPIFTKKEKFLILTQKLRATFKRIIVKKMSILSITGP